MHKMKTRLLLIVTMLLVSACSGFRETGVSEDGATRQIVTEHTEEIEVPANPEARRAAAWRRCRQRGTVGGRCCGCG
ncbi:hypothetical protein [Salinicoccus sp. CNSTN-B1]